VVFWGALGFLQGIGVLHIFSGEAVPALIIAGVVFAFVGLLASRWGTSTV
jgi:hypothetical protein